jgi:hypothetical protein
VELPRGVALVRVRDHEYKVVLVSDKLTHDEEVAGRLLAAIAAHSRPFVLLTMKDISAAMAAALSLVVFVV